jgi:SET domain-containing protein
MNNKIIKPAIIEIRPTTMSMGGIGLFATRTLKKDTIIARAELLGEEFHPWSQYKMLDKPTRRKVDAYCLQTPEGFYTPKDFNYMTVPWNMNHSCNYNIGFDNEGNFVTTRTIKANEELTWDYGMGMSNPKFRLTCSCESKNCRKTITGSDWKDEAFLMKNKKYFMRELLELQDKI